MPFFNLIDNKIKIYQYVSNYSNLVDRYVVQMLEIFNFYNIQSSDLSFRDTCS